MTDISYLLQTGKFYLINWRGTSHKNTFLIRVEKLTYRDVLFFERPSITLAA